MFIMSSFRYFLPRLYELFRKLRHDCIARTPQEAHASTMVGMPIISQREKPGFSRYPAVFAIEVSVDSVVAPRPASAATLGSMSSRLRSVPSGFVPVCAMPGVSFQSRALHVGWPASFATSSRSAPPAFRFSLLLFGPPDGVFGVG
jgi:hypothetical protein